MPSLAPIRQVAYIVTERRNHGLSCRVEPPTRQLLACLDSSQTDEKLAEIKHRGFHLWSISQDTKTNEYHGRAEVRHVLSVAKAQEWGSSTNSRQFEATHETRKLPNVYLERLSHSDAIPTISRGHGWELEDDCLKPAYMRKDPAPCSLIALTTCNSKRAQCQGNCSCYNSDLSCTEACLFMADETIKNPDTAGVQCDSKSEEESDDDLEDEEERNGIEEDN